MIITALQIIRSRLLLRYAGVLVAAGIMVLVFRIKAIPAENNSYIPLGKHDQDLETWSVHARIDFPEKNKPIYLGLFFVSGKLYFFQGNLAHIFWMDASTDTYTYESAIFIPPFAEVAHDDHRLNEKFNTSALRYDKKKNLIHVTADFSKLHPRLDLYSEKEIIRFDQVFDKNKADALFDWYMMPRTRVEADIDGKPNDGVPGIGHFQHYWGDNVYEGGHFIVAHMDSGYDILISTVAAKDRNQPYMPNPYIMITTPKDEKQCIRSFTCTVLEWWESESTRKRYPVNVRVSTADSSLSLDIRAFKKNQTAKLLGVEKWFGYGSVEGVVQDTPQHGWAFMSMYGERAKQ